MHSVVGVWKCIMNRACIFGVAFHGVVCAIGNRVHFLKSMKVASFMDMKWRCDERKRHWAWTLNTHEWSNFSHIED